MSAATAHSLMSAVCPDPELSNLLKTQANEFQSVCAGFGRLGRLSFADDVVAVSDPQSSTKISLLDVIETVRQSYNTMAAAQYGAVQQLNTLAILQGVRAISLRRGRLSPQQFLNNSSITIAAIARDADRAVTIGSIAGPEFAQKLTTTKSHISELTKAMASAKSEIDKREQADRGKVTGIIVSAALTGFATGDLVAAACAAVYAGVPQASLASFLARDDVPTAKVAQSEGEKLGKDEQAAWEYIRVHIRKANGLADAMTISRGLSDKLSLQQLVTLVSIIETAVIVMERALKTVEDTQTPLDRLIQSVTGSAKDLKSMNDNCLQLSQEMHSTAKVSMSEQDAREMTSQWKDIEIASEALLDVFNRQGISHSADS